MKTSSWICLVSVLRQDDVGKRRLLDLLQRLGVEALIFEPEPVAIAQGLELHGDDGLDSLTDQRAGGMILR